MPIYDQDDFDKSIIPAALKKEAKELIVVAVGLGWKVHVTSSQSVTIIAPDERKKYHFSTNRRNSIGTKRIQRDIIRFADPTRLAIAQAAGDAWAAGFEETSVAMSSALMDASEESVIDQRPETEPKKPKREPKIVSERPMLAKADKDLGYESPTTIERKWDDGTTDWKCVSCDYTSGASRGSVSAHYGKTHSGPGTKARPEKFKVDIPDARVYAPRRSRIEALAQHLADAIAGGAVDPETVAREALIWVNEQTRKGTGLAAEREDMTAEEALSRIRMLIDDGSHFRQRQELEQTEQRINELEKGLAEAQARADQAEQVAEAAKQSAEDAWGNLAALRDLVAGLPDQKQAG